MEKSSQNCILAIITGLCLSAAYNVHAQQAGTTAKQQGNALAGTVFSVKEKIIPGDSLPAAHSTKEMIKDAWWTGPVLAPSAGTLPPGHILAEPYFYDVKTPGNNGFGSLSYLLVGVANGFTAGCIPVFGYNKVGGGGLSSSGPQFGDFTLVGQFRLRKYKQGNWLPAMALNVQQSFPTGKYDQLGSRPSNGFGGGAYTTTVALYTQTYFWLNTGRILRVRLNFSQAFSTTAALKDVSVYGTSQGFVGHARPGSPFTFDAAAEYSLTRNWVLATDIAWKYTTNTSVTGYTAQNPGGPQPPATTMNTGVSHGFIFAPAIEYNFTGSLGILFGTRIIPNGYNTGHSVTPVIAINYVH